MRSINSSDKPEEVLRQLIEAQRTRLLQAHAVMICLREVLLYAEGEDAVIYAEAANAAALLVNDVAEGLDSVKLQPLLGAIRLERTYRPTSERGLTLGTDDDSSVREPTSAVRLVAGACSQGKVPPLGRDRRRKDESQALLDTLRLSAALGPDALEYVK